MRKNKFAYLRFYFGQHFVFFYLKFIIVARIYALFWCRGYISIFRVFTEVGLFSIGISLFVINKLLVSKNNNYDLLLRRQ